MRRLNFIFGILNILFSISLVSLGIIYMNIVLDGVTFTSNIRDVYNSLGITNVIAVGVVELFAVAMFVIGCIYLVNSVKIIIWEEKKHKIKICTAINLIIDVLLMIVSGALFVGVMLNKFNFGLRADAVVISSIIAILSLWLALMSIVMYEYVKSIENKASANKITINKSVSKEGNVVTADNSIKTDFVEPKFNIGKK